MVLERITAEAQRLTDDGGIADRLHPGQPPARHRRVDCRRPTSNWSCSTPCSRCSTISRRPSARQQQWKQHRLSTACRASAARTERLALHREMAAAAPWDAWPQTTTPADLADAGEHEAAYAWLQQEIDRNPRRLPSDVNSASCSPTPTCCTSKADMPTRRIFCAERVEQGPEDQDDLLRITCRALVFADRVAQAESLVEEWLNIGDDAAADAKLRPARPGSAAGGGRLRPRKSPQHQRQSHRGKVAAAAGRGRAAVRDAPAPRGHRRADHRRLAILRQRRGRRRSPRAVRAAPGRSRRRSRRRSCRRSSGGSIGKPPETHARRVGGEIAATIRERWSQRPTPQEKDALGQALVDDLRQSLRRRASTCRSCAARSTPRRREYRTGYVVAVVRGAARAAVDRRASRPRRSGCCRNCRTPRTPSIGSPSQLPALYRLVDRMINARVEHDAQRAASDGPPGEAHADGSWRRRKRSS